MTKRHDREYFYKFMTAETAKIVLRNSSLRWREPRQFNDPFDHQMSFSFPFAHEELMDYLISDIEKLVYDDDQIVLEDTLLSKMINLLRVTKHKISKDELHNTLIDGIQQYVGKFDDYKVNMNSLITGDLNESRVLCVSEKNDNVVMWSHYASEHRGVCMRLQCIEELDNTLLLAKPVTYQDSFPEFLSLDKFVNYLTGEKLVSMSDLIFEIPYVKHVDWSYENEWRVHVPFQASNTGGYDDWKENPRVFGAIYLGCRMQPNYIGELMQIIECDYPHMEIYQARQSTDAFVLEFDKIR